MTNNKWYTVNNEEADVVVSSRVRLARNLRDLPFPRRMTPEQRRELCGRVSKAIDAGKFTGGLAFSKLDMGKLTNEQVLSLVERHCISPEFAQEREGRLLLLSADESVSVMVGEEDHLRIQVISANKNLASCMELANQLDDLLDEQLEFAFDEKLGYLTQCPTNLGTGLRASVMLHLPALEQTGAAAKLAANVQKLGLTLRGTYGEGSKAQGSLYQLSNQVTLGISEEAAVQNLSGIAQQIIDQERRARKALAEQPNLCDAIWRAYGVLRYCRSLSSEEFIKYLSFVRLGAALGYFEQLDFAALDTLLYTAGAGSIMAAQRRQMSPAQRDTARAEMVRQALAGSAA